MLGKAALYDAFGRRFERTVGTRLRRTELAPSRGRVLEIGAGTGANLPHYPEGVEELVLTEPDGAMLKRLRKRAAEHGREATVLQASAEALPFNDASFDTVVATVVLCSVPSQATALREVRRVLRPGGQFLFAEHVRSDDPRRARRQDRLDRPWSIVASGCHPNRETLAAIEAAGFEVQELERSELPMGPRLVRPYILGRATVPAAHP
jgi:ubiquinone/menaquinone biosynthesis C-methylase UbiE